MARSKIEYKQVIDRGCGLDVHRDTVAVTVMGKGIETQTQTFGTTTSSLNELGIWLASLKVTNGAMESTGSYWKPVVHVLRAYPINLIVVNARHIKNIPGRKTDQADSQWICNLLISGLLKITSVTAQRAKFFMKYLPILVLFTPLLNLNYGLAQIKPASDKLYFISDCQQPMKVEELRLKPYRNEEARDSLFADIIRQNPRYLFLLGDLTAAGSHKKLWKPLDSFLYILNNQNVSVNAIPGNHEYFTNADKGIKNFKKRFPQDSLLGYCVKTDSMAIVMLNSNFSKLTKFEIQKQQHWYEATMDSLDTDRRIKIIFTCTHYSPFTNSKIVSPSKPVEQYFLPRFLHSPKTRLFISGHSHNLEYFQNNTNKYFLVIGGGGGLLQPLYPYNKQLYQDLLQQENKPLYFYITVERNGNKIYLKARGLQKYFSKVNDFKIGTIE